MGARLDAIYLTPPSKKPLLKPITKLTIINAHLHAFNLFSLHHSGKKFLTDFWQYRIGQYRIHHTCATLRNVPKKGPLDWWSNLSGKPENLMQLNGTVLSADRWCIAPNYKWNPS